MSSNQEIVHADGRNGQIELVAPVVRIRRAGFVAGIGKLKEKDIFLDQIATTKIMKATLFLNGYLQIVPLGFAPVSGVLANAKNENSVMFSYKNMGAFEALNDELQRRVNRFPNEQRAYVALAEKAKPTANFLQMKNTDGDKAKNFANLYALASSLVTTVLIRYFVEPWVIRTFDTSIPWWLYLLFFLLLYGSLIQRLAKLKAIDNVAYGEIRTRVVSTSKGIFCTKCGAATTSDDRFCPGCGNRRQ